MKLQVAALQREALMLRGSLQAKDTALANALEDGSAQVQELQVARQELLLQLETAEQQMQVQHISSRHLPAPADAARQPNRSSVSVAPFKHIVDSLLITRCMIDPVMLVAAMARNVWSRLSLLCRVLHSKRPRSTHGQMF